MSRASNRARACRRVAFTVGIATTGAAWAADRVSTFKPGNGSWGTASAWDPAGVPNNGALTYDAVFNGTITPQQMLTLNQNVTIEKFTISGGLLAGPTSGTPPTMTLNDDLLWRGGYIARATVLALSGGRIDAAVTCTLGTATLDNRGVLTYTAAFGQTPDGNYALRLDSNGFIINRAGATFDIAGDGGISTTSSATSRIDNFGSWVKSAGTGVSRVMPKFNSSGTVRVDSGRLEFVGGSTYSSSLTAAAGATLSFVGGPHTIEPTATVGGDGSVWMANDVDFKGTLLGGAGAVVVNQPGVKFSAGADVASLGLAAGGRPVRILETGKVTFDTGQLVRFADFATDSSRSPNSNTAMLLTGDDDFAFNGPAAWGGGFVASTGARRTLAVDAGMTVSGLGMGIDNRRVLNNSTVTWDGGYIQLRNGGLIENAAGATFDIRTDTRIEWGTTKTGFPLPTMTNAGLIVKSAGTGEALVDDVRLTNTGTVRVESGVLEFTHSGWSGGGPGYPDTGVNFGVYEVGPAGTLAFHDHTMEVGSTVRGPGTMTFLSNNNLIKGTYDVSGRTIAKGGLYFEPGAVVANAGAVFEVDFTGFVTFATGGPVTLNDVVVNGLLMGSDPITIAGSVSGSGSIQAANVIAPGLVEPGNSPGNLNVPGKLTMTGTTDLVMEIGGNLNEPDKLIWRYDVLSASGSVVLDGDLLVRLINGYVPKATDRLTVVSASGVLSGAFDNVLSGQRVFTSGTGAFGSFQVNYGTGSPFGKDNVVLSNFRAEVVPEPVGGVWLIGAGVLLARRRTKRDGR